LEKLDKGNDISRIFFCTTYTKFEPMMGRPLEEASCNNVDVFKLDTSVWIIELSGMFYGVIQKYQ